jgi:hypothetical protein
VIIVIVHSILIPSYENVIATKTINYIGIGNIIKKVFKQMNLKTFLKYLKTLYFKF